VPEEVRERTARPLERTEVRIGRGLENAAVRPHQAIGVRVFFDELPEWLLAIGADIDVSNFHVERDDGV
jgi:hypothetical protein